MKRGLLEELIQSVSASTHGGVERKVLFVEVVLPWVRTSCVSCWCRQLLAIAVICWVRRWIVAVHWACWASIRSAEEVSICCKRSSICCLAVCPALASSARGRASVVVAAALAGVALDSSSLLVGFVGLALS